MTVYEGEKLQTFLQQEQPCFTDIHGTTPLNKHQISLTNPELIKQLYRLQKPQMQQLINEEIDRILEEGIIEPSSSSWSSPVVLSEITTGYTGFALTSKIDGRFFKAFEQGMLKAYYKLGMVLKGLNADEES